MFKRRPSKYKLCLTNPVRRGANGQPSVIGITCAYINQWAKGSRRLKSLDYRGRFKRNMRTERCEAIAAVVNDLVAKELNLESRRCARKNGLYTVVPQASLIAHRISQDSHWKREPMTISRVYRALVTLEEAGYITRTKQYRRHKSNGDWLPTPKMITFTKRFFLELGGKKLFKSIQGHARSAMAMLEKSGVDIMQHFSAHEIIARYQYKYREEYGIKPRFSDQPPDPTEGCPDLAPDLEWAY